MTTVLHTSEKQSVRDWNSYYESFIAKVSADHNETDEQRALRIIELEADFEKWKMYYFPKYCFAPSASFQKKAAARELANEEWYESRIWARELAKDVVEMMVTLYQTLTGIKKNILFISNSWDKASELLEPYRINLERNERIIHDYGIQQMPGSWTYGDFVTTKGISFLAVGADQSPRGSRNEEVRPDKVIISDIDTDQDCRNANIINKRWEWFERAVFPTRSVSKPFQVIWLGNLIAKYCCVSKAIEKADYVDRVNLEDKNGNSTWPEKNSQENIARIKSKISFAAYQSEYMNNPIIVGKVFKDIQWAKCPRMSTHKFIVNYGDPAQSNKDNKSNCYKAVVQLALSNGTLYVYNCRLDQVTNAKFVNFYYELQIKEEKVQVYNFIENNSLQDPFYEQVFIPLFVEAGKRTGHTINITPDKRKKADKFSRIEGALEPLNRNGKLIFNIDEKNNPHMKLLEEQFKAVNPQLSAPVDGPDAVEGGLYILQTKQRATIPFDLGMRSSQQNPNRF
jgi:hypothetical protein